jgi:hypothetical protein
VAAAGACPTVRPDLRIRLAHRGVSHYLLNSQYRSQSSEVDLEVRSWLDSPLRTPSRVVFGAFRSGMPEPERGAPAASSDVHLGGEGAQPSPPFEIWCRGARHSYRNRESKPRKQISFAEALHMLTLEGAEAISITDAVDGLEVSQKPTS